MEISKSYDEIIFNEIINLIKKRKINLAEEKLNSITEKNAIWTYLYGLMLFNKSWYDSAISYFNTAISLDPSNDFIKESYANLMSRHKHYCDDYYHGGYRRRNRGCSCCCCDDCCCDFDISCCDLICLDQCCECMGGDLIECI